jgi:hypothetical protein
MTQIQTDPDLASLREDPRFTALLPVPADFAAPFVEDVKILCARGENARTWERV